MGGTDQKCVYGKTDAKTFQISFFFCILVKFIISMYFTNLGSLLGVLDSAFWPRKQNMSDPVRVQNPFLAAGILRVR